MKIAPTGSVEAGDVVMEGARGCRVRWLIGEPDGAPNFAMRQFEVAPGGHTPRHRHPYEHEVFVLEGRGVVVEGSREHPLAAGDAVYVAPDEVHQFRNTGEGVMKFLCLVPHSAADGKVTVVPECAEAPPAVPSPRSGVE